MMENFNGCTALITGASAGLGHEFARQLATRADHLILVARRLDRLEQIKAELEREGLTVWVRACDLSDDDELQSLIDWLYDEPPPIDFLVNNAGLGDHGDFHNGEWDRVRAMLAVNVVALTKLTFTLLPMLRRREGAAILNVSSIAGFLPLPGMAVYAATKAYVTSFSEAIRMELRGTGVTVTALCPGPVNTEFSAVSRRAGGGSLRSPEAFKVDPARVVRAGLDAVVQDRPRVVPGWIVCLVMALAAALPMLLLRPCLTARKRG